MMIYQAGRIAAVAGCLLAITTWIYFLVSNRVGVHGLGPKPRRVRASCRFSQSDSPGNVWGASSGAS